MNGGPAVCVPIAGHDCLESAHSGLAVQRTDKKKTYELFEAYREFRGGDLGACRQLEGVRGYRDCALGLRHHGGQFFDNAPLGATEQHFQQVFSSSLLTGLNVGDYITGLAFRVEGNETSLPAQTVTTYDIGMGQSAFAPGSLSSTFADNRGPDFQTVRSGPLTINAGDFSGGSSPNNFGWIPFSTPYQYEGGNLLVEISYEGFSVGRDADAAYPITAGLAQTAFGTGFGSTTADAGVFDEAMVMGFSTISIPEPSSASLLGGFGLLLVVQRVFRNRPA